MAQLGLRVGFGAHRRYRRLCSHGVRRLRHRVSVLELSQPTPFRTDLDAISEDLSDAELDLVMPMYEQFADLNGVPSAAAYEARAFRLERIARWLGDEDAGRVRAEANLIVADILACSPVRSSVSLGIGRHLPSSAKALSSFTSTFAVAVLSFGLGADWLQSEKTDPIDVAKKCADARAVATVVESELPEICGTPTEKEGTSKTAATEIAGASTALASRYESCLAVAETATEYDRLKTAMQALLP
jgi:hypothetical protein